MINIYMPVHLARVSRAAWQSWMMPSPSQKPRLPPSEEISLVTLSPG